MERASGRQAHEGSTERQAAERREQGGRDLPRHPGTRQRHHAERQRQEQQGSPPAVDDGRHGDRGEQRRGNGSQDRETGGERRQRQHAKRSDEERARGPRAPRPETVGPRGARVRADWGAPQAPLRSPRARRVQLRLQRSSAGCGGRGRHGRTMLRRNPRRIDNVWRPSDRKRRSERRASPPTVWGQTCDFLEDSWLS